MDIDGQPWGTPPCMGADQLLPGQTQGPLTVSLRTEFSFLAVGFVARFEADIEGQTTGNRWDFGDGAVLLNRLEVDHAWQAPGTYPVRLTAFNDSNPGGLTTTITVQVIPAPVFYVNQANPNPSSPYASWETAATNIQQAIGVAPVAGRVVLVTNGIYDAGGLAVSGLMTNRIALTDGVVVRSVNGPGATWIVGAAAPGSTNGDGAIRCAYVGAGSLLDGFTLTNGHTLTNGLSSREQGGGGVWCEQTGVVTNCVITGNEAFRDGGGANGGIFYGCTFRENQSGDDSGGVDDAVLYGCTLIGNRANSGGGGASECTLYDCTLITNSANSGGGASWSTLHGCTLLTNSATHGGGGVWDGILTRCTLIGNSSALHGGAAWAATLDHCLLTGNSSRHGGGANASTLYNCLLTGNSARRGGGSYGGMLYDCTLTGNSTYYEGGGVYNSILRNCILYYNTAPSGPNHYYLPNSAYCCTVPAPYDGLGHITNAPLFVDPATFNFRLQSNSPCINAGNNSYVTEATDLDGNPRIVSGTADMGAYEFQGAGSIISYAWLQQYGLPIDGSADSVDSDNDGHTTYQEWQVGTNPTNALSALRLLPPVDTPAGVKVTWSSVTNQTYFLERSTDLAASPTFLILAAGIRGQSGTTTFTDTNPPAPCFYRVGTEP